MITANIFILLFQEGDLVVVNVEKQSFKCVIFRVLNFNHATKLNRKLTNDS